MSSQPLPSIKPPPPPAPGSRVGTLAVWVIVIAGLYFAQEVLIPLALAVLLSFLLAPIAARLERWHLGRIGSAVVVILLAVGILGGLGYVVTSQFVDLAGKLPGYRGTIVKKIRNLRPSDGAFTKATAAWEDLRREVNAPTTGTLRQTTTTVSKTTATLTDAGLATVSKAVTQGTKVQQPPSGQQLLQNNSVPEIAQAPLAVETAPSEEGEPVAVKVVEQTTSPLETVGSILGPIMSWLGTAGLVVVFVLFMLLQRDDLRDRIIRLAGQSRIQVTTEALDEAGSRVSRYLLMQLIVNVSYGIPVAVGLHFIGLPNAMLWGVLATVLRFIPYIGPWIGATIPILLSVAVFDDWSRTFMVIGMYIVLELVSNNLMEPMLYGHSTGVSPIAIIISAVFWTWLWGPVGLLLATPMTVCLSVLGRYVPNMGFLNVLLGDEPVLPPGARVYNRLLADDVEEGLEVAEEFLEKHSPVELYDEVLMCALAMAEQDRHQGALSVEKERLIWTSMAELIDMTSERIEKKTRKARAKESGPDTEVDLRAAEAAETMPGHRILVLPARDAADELAASMLARVLTDGRPHQVRVVSVEALAGEMVAQIHDFKPDLVFISAMPPLATTHARYLVKRLKAECGDLRVMVGLWYAEGSMDIAVERLKGAGAESIVRTMDEALGKL